MAEKKTKKSSGAPAPVVSEKKPKLLKGLLKGYGYTHEYVSWSVDEFEVEIHKIKLGIAALDPATRAWLPEAEAPEASYSITNDTCSCQAGDHGRECKHVEMIHGEYEGHTFARDAAESEALDYLDRFKEKKGAKGTVIGALAYGDTSKVRRADLLIYYGPNGSTCDVVIHAETPIGLLLRAIFAHSEERYLRLLAEARVAWASKRRVI